MILPVAVLCVWQLLAWLIDDNEFIGKNYRLFVLVKGSPQGICLRKEILPGNEPCMLLNLFYEDGKGRIEKKVEVKGGVITGILPSVLD